MRALGARRIVVSEKDGYVRASFHAYNDESDVETLLGALDAQNRARRQEITQGKAPGFGDMFAQMEEELSERADALNQKFAQPDFAMERNKLAGMYEEGRIGQDVYAAALDELNKKDPAEALVARLDQQEARAEARRVRAEAKEAHKAKLEEARAAGVVLSDDEKTFKDPVKAQYLAACKTYSPEKEAFISALESPPYGVSVLPQEVIDQGRQAIKAVVCRDLLAAQASAQVRLAQAKALAQIAEQAMHHLPGQQEDRPLMTDQDRQGATA